jgi:glycosyltransferase involved in cell wall biosynthesis
MKIYEQLAIGVPLVATRIDAHTQVLNDDVAFLVTPDPEGIAQGLYQALESPENGSQVTARARKLYKQKYSRPAYVGKIQHVLHLLVDRQ